MNKAALMSAISVGEIFQNPKSGTSTISSVTDKNITYIRGRTSINFPISVFFSVVNEFAGKKCSSSNLKEYMPEIFDSNPSINNVKAGHSCNCTFLFLLAEKMGLIENGIQGKGKRGNPFFVIFK